MNKTLLSLAALLALVPAIQAQELKEGYVTFPSSSKLHEYVNAWNGGAGKISVDGAIWEDEEFFTCRVKPRTRITHTGADIYNFNDKAGRRSLWWVPIGLPATQALPNGRFDSEVFSMWSYLDHYGTWTTPFGWSVGAMSDIAHKNGVAVSGVASIPNASLPSDWNTCFTSLGSNYGSDQKIENFGKFLLYHGCDGLGYNSEFSGGASAVSNIMNFHNALYEWMADKDPIFENIWYDGTNESGNISFDSALNGKTNIYKASSVFSNYNWTSLLASGQQRAESVNGLDGTPRGPWWQYAGMDQQGGQPKNGVTYPNVNNYKWSLGWWGAHVSNMFWENRNSGGSGEDRMLAHYLYQTETFFGNGPRNPAIKMPLTTKRDHRPYADYHGVSAQINERSAINHQTNLEPFYTFFNLGNGKFFNWKGQRVSDKKWYSIGIQDFLPTWRFWFAPTWLQKDVPQGYRKLDASFTWEDAYFGGSCLKIEGSADTEYLHLFKTEIKPSVGFLTVRYKLLEGEADIRLVVTGVSEPEKQTAKWGDVTLCSVVESPQIQDQSYRDGADGWVTKTYKITAPHYSSSNLPGAKIGVIGLEFKNAKNMKLLLGELSIMPAKNTVTPASPTIKSSKILANVYEGIDAKIIWTMDGDEARNAGTPLYNFDVNTSMFKVYAQEEGGPETFVGTTTSWAAIAFQAPNTDNSRRIRFGVSAVALDTNTESPIAWGNYLSKGTYTPSNEISINKASVKPNESFEIYYNDRNHASSSFKIKNTNGQVVASGNGTSLKVPAGLPDLGGYDLYVDEGTANERVLGYFVQITSEAVGAMPEIHSVAINGQDASTMDILKINTTDKPVLSYTGRSCNGSASRALALNSHYIGTRSTEIGLSEGNQSFTVAGWFYFKEMPTQKWSFMNVSDKTGSWPSCNWGWAWNYGMPDGKIYCVFRGAPSQSGLTPGELHYQYENTTIKAGSWMHIAWVCEYNEQKAFRNLLYINGVKQTPTKVFRYAKSNNGTNTVYGAFDFVPREGAQVSISASDYFYFGGAYHEGQAIDGLVDDFQVWNKAVSDDDLKLSMQGLDANNLPSTVAAFWDFESKPNDDNSFTGAGSFSGTKLAYTYDIEHLNGDPNASCYYAYKVPAFTAGCPFLSGTAFPIETKAEWKDLADRHTLFTKAGARSQGNEGAEGSATVEFKNGGDHNIQLSLTNDYGTATTGKDDAAQFTFPVIEVPETMGIDGVDADGADVLTSVDGRVVYLSYAGEGSYAIQAFNTAGMLVASEAVNAVAGGSSELTFTAPGVYLVKVVKNGTPLRTIKVSVK